MQRKNTAALLVLLLFVLLNIMPAHAGDPLPSWNDGEVKSAIIQFVKDVTHKGGQKYVPPEDRIATFDNDGTLCCETPVFQMLYVREALKAIVAKKPELLEKPAFKAVIDGNMEYLEKSPDVGNDIMKMLALTHSGMSLDEFQASVREFIKTAKYPKFDMPLTHMKYKPMVELLSYLRANGFKTYICSGGGLYFMRVFTNEMYGIPPEQVIGATGKLQFEFIDGKVSLMRLPVMLTMNNREEKPTGIAMSIGKKPIFAAGNVKGAGDIAMMQYCQSNSYPSFQLIINHDDSEREFAYSEPENETLNAAEKFKWFVVSMKKDWKKIFPFEK